jgi:hypothetical protein
VREDFRKSSRIPYTGHHGLTLDNRLLHSCKGLKL